jgi:putative thioredoxin
MNWSQNNQWGLPPLQATTTATPPAPSASPQRAPAPTAASFVFDVTEAGFEAEVLERSMHTPVLLDCWAPWCGPCRSLGPILEKLANSSGGRFVLAKLNTDEAPNIAAAMRLRSIPLVALFVGGRVVDQFVGALPEGQIRQFLDKHLPPAGAATAAEAPPDAEALRLEAAKFAKQGGDPAEVEAILQEALSLDPAHLASRLDLADLWLMGGETTAAQELLEGVPAEQRNERHAALVKRIALMANRPPGDPAALAERIAANGRDFEARFALAALQVWQADWAAAFEQLLDVVLRDRAEGKPDREKARVQMVEWLASCPDAELVDASRRKLAMYLN